MKEIYERIWESLSVTNLGGSCVMISRIWRGMQHGYTEYCCFLCEWDRRDKKNHYVNKLWPKQTSLTPGEKNSINPPLFLPDKIYLPPLHIKLGLIKILVKSMDTTGHRFKYEEKE
jgi:hypothetical protein